MSANPNTTRQPEPVTSGSSTARAPSISYEPRKRVVSLELPLDSEGFYPRLSDSGKSILLTGAAESRMAVAGFDGKLTINANVSVSINDPSVTDELYELARNNRTQHKLAKNGASDAGKRKAQAWEDTAKRPSGT